jgi:hypothetical protein
MEQLAEAGSAHILLQRDTHTLERAVIEVVKPAPRIVRYFLAAGFLIPCLLYLVIFLGHVKVQGVWDWILLIPWPTSVLLMSAEAGGGAVGKVIAFVISAGANMVVYGLLGSLVSFCYRRFFLRTT